MSTSESDANNELLKSISISLKGIHSSLEYLTAAVEGVAESIEKAHEPEGDLGVHLVSSLKDLTSALHKRAQQERVSQPQQGQGQRQQQHQGRRDDRNQRPRQQDGRPPIQQEAHHGQDQSPGDDFEQPDEPTRFAADDQEGNASFEHVAREEGTHTEGSDPEGGNLPKTANPRPRPNRRRRGGNSGGKAPAKKLANP